MNYSTRTDTKFCSISDIFNHEHLREEKLHWAVLTLPLLLIVINCFFPRQEGTSTWIWQSGRSDVFRVVL